MKYDISCKVFNIFFSKMLKAYFKENFPEVDIKKTIRDVKKEYKAIILRTPGLSKDNLMAGNLKGASYFLAMAKKIPNMSPELMDKIIEKCMYSKFMVNMNKKAAKTGAMFKESNQDKMYKDSLRSQKSNDEMDWTYEFFKGKDEYKYNITRCGVCKLCERENLLEYLPCLCKMDYPKFDVKGAKLIRTKTLANGDECCDFHLVRKNLDK